MVSRRICNAEVTGSSPVGSIDQLRLGTSDYMIEKLAHAGADGLE